MTEGRLRKHTLYNTRLCAYWETCLRASTSSQCNAPRSRSYSICSNQVLCLTYRYTECRLRGLSTALFLDDLPYNTVDMSPTFDGSQDEPTVLPARVPHLLVNGAAGIAVGIATKIPPHNLREVVAAMTALIKDPNISLAKLMKHIPAPDFPTGVLWMGKHPIGADLCVSASQTDSVW